MILDSQINDLYKLYEISIYSTRELSKITGISKSYIHKLIQNKYGKFDLKTEIERFLDKFIPEPNTGCWLWIGGIADNGYGNFFYNSRLRKAHQFAWEFYKSPIPEGLEICHKCDIRNCVNPEHLFLGTRKDNMLDASKKGRLGKNRIK